MTLAFAFRIARFLINLDKSVSKSWYGVPSATKSRGPNTMQRKRCVQSVMCAGCGKSLCWTLARHLSSAINTANLVFACYRTCFRVAKKQILMGMEALRWFGTGCGGIWESGGFSGVDRESGRLEFQKYSQRQIPATASSRICFGCVQCEHLRRASMPVLFMSVFSCQAQYCRVFFFTNPSHRSVKKNAAFHRVSPTAADHPPL